MKIFGLNELEYISEKTKTPKPRKDLRKKSENLFRKKKRRRRE